MIGAKTFAAVILFSVLFGGILYLVTTFLLKKLGEEKKGKRTKHIWVWRISIFLVIIYMILVIWMNKQAFDLTLVSPFDFLFMAFLIVFFVTLVEVTIIELLLPDILKLRYRIGLEIVIFFLISASSLLMFFVFSNILGL